MLQNINRWIENDHHYPIERAITIGIGLLALWFIALMTFMENGQNHVINLAFVSVLTVLLIVLARTLPKTKYQGYLVAIAATMIAVIGYFRLNSFFIHTEIVFTLAVIGVAACIPHFSAFAIPSGNHDSVHRMKSDTNSKPALLKD